ncbi:MAG TPA: ribonuclease III [Candidatus Woesebacteria bacterium]|nr:ribonuclease III [Candidatus Woesebacteria bacterium]
MEHAEQLEKTINIEFKNKTLLKNVFIHRSYLNEHKELGLPSNEKLEFLGDSVLSLATSIYLYQNYTHLAEGDYTDIKASIVRTESLAEVAKNLELGTYLFLSKGEEKGEGRDKTNILADCFEALIAAIFIDQGFDTAYKFITNYLFKDKLKYIVENKLYMSPKSRLQELTQATYKNLPQYILSNSTGPEHKKEFNVEVLINGKKVAEGQGMSKKHAEENAAQNALEKFQ